MDIGQFDAVAESERPYPVEMKSTDGITGTGVTLLVVGKYAEAVIKWLAKVINANTREAQIAAKKGAVAPAKSLEEIRQQNIEGACVRVVSWTGPDQAFTPELLLRTMTRNPHWCDQVVEASDNLGNFSTPQ